MTAEGVRTVVGILAVVLICDAGDAMTRTVPGQFPTIQSAVDASAAGDTVLVSPGVYTDWEVRDIPGLGSWTFCVLLKDGVILRSEGGASGTTIDMSLAVGPQKNAVLAQYLDSGTTSFEGFTVANAPRGFFLATSALVTIRDCIFRDSDAVGSTGAGVAANGDIVLERCEFRNCRANSGGAVMHANGRIWMYDCVVEDCSNIAVDLSGNFSPPTESSVVERCVFRNCINGSSAVGAMFIGDHAGGANVRNCLFEGNQGTSFGAGALSMAGVGPKTVEGCLFLNNRAAGGNGQGGGLHLGSPGTIRNNTFFGNAAVTTSGGDAISLVRHSPLLFIALENNVIAASDGPAIVAHEAPYTSSCNIFWQNVGGSGIYFTPGPTDREIDPLFCDPIIYDFTVRADSPCLPEHSPFCGAIGAFGEGCGPISVDATSWGHIKDAFRSLNGGRP